jgi:serine/threonine protein kinase
MIEARQGAIAMSPSFKVMHELNSGGFARVYLVIGPDGGQYAMKVLQPNQQLLDNVPAAELRRRFVREATYQQSINHPNVVPVLYVDTAAEPPYYVMPLADGTLEEDIRADHTLGGNPKPVLFDILGGLQHISERGFIHRDLKPANVLKFKSGDGTTRYAISDFGLMNPGAADTTTLTMTGAKGGTVPYAAPELIVDLSRATVAADIYSFGAILHDIFVNQSRVPYTQLTAAGPIGPVVQTCTNRNPKRRYESIAQLREALFQVLDTYVPTFSSSNEQRVAELLGASVELSSEQWDDVLMTLDDNDDKKIPNENLLRALKSEHFAHLNADSPPLMKSLGMRFCEFAIGRAFNFDYCDILASRLEAIYAVGDIELKAATMLAFLELGTSHNRWLVERAFYSRALLDADPNVIQRFITEANVRGYDIKKAIDHLNGSIIVDITKYHPLILAALN